jgi:hypothetical protein
VLRRERPSTHHERRAFSAAATPLDGTRSESERSMNRSKATTNHDEIRRWAEARDGKPVAVRGTSRGKQDVGMIRIDFPGYSGGGKLAPIEWDQWFEKFDDANLAMILQDRTAKGQKSNFNKLVARESLEADDSGKGMRVNKAKTRRAARPSSGAKAAPRAKAASRAKPASRTRTARTSKSRSNGRKS